MKLNLRSIDLNLLTVFDAIMETGQLSSAGERLGMSQPAMSAALARLRQTMGDDLFIRSHQGMLPTPRAKALHHTIAEALQSIRIELQSNTVFDPALCNRHFRVMGGDYVEMLFYGSLLARAHSRAPGVTSEVKPLQINGYEKALQLGEVDVAVHYALASDEGLSYEHILDDRLVVLARKHHPKIRKKMTESIFYTEKHVTLMTGKDNISHLDNFMGNDGVQRNIGAKVAQFASMIPAIVNSDYLCVMPENLAKRFSLYFELACFPIPFPTPELPIYLVWGSRFNRDLAHVWFREELKAVMLE
tara:strand:+ start:13496 stop:14404 length:909 start_codon:yes stop_codon:yes gene_type:complete